MDPEASLGSLSHVPGTGRPVPEAEPGLVQRWRSGGGELVELLAQVRERFGSIAAFRLGPAPTVLVTDPQAVQHVLALHPDRYVKRSHRARLLIGDGVLAATGDGVEAPTPPAAVPVHRYRDAPLRTADHRGCPDHRRALGRVRPYRADPRRRAGDAPLRPGRHLALPHRAPPR